MTRAAIDLDMSDILYLRVGRLDVVGVVQGGNGRTPLHLLSCVHPIDPRGDLLRAMANAVHYTIILG
jgi:hypothetical protein